MSLFTELKNRNVFRVAAAYIVSAWLVIQVVETILPAFGFGDAAVRYVTIAFAVGLVPALVLAWVFEWTPEGIRRESEVDDHAPASVAAARRFDRLILIVLALALGYFAFDKFILEPQRTAAERQRQAEVLAEATEEARRAGRTEALVESYGDQSIAVLAFQDMSPARDQEYLSDGIAEEILNLLARIPELRVISRSSAFTFKGKDVPVPEIARQLNVAHILEGSVRKSGDRIRITAQLIEARSDTHLWSENYDRTLDDIFAIQDEIAADVVKNLQLILSKPIPTSRRTDPEAYALTLQAKQLLELRSDPQLDEVAALLERALAIDPSYVPALEAEIAFDYDLFLEGEISRDEVERRWRSSRDRILALDPDNGIVHSYIAWDLYQEERNIEAAAAEYQALIAREPNNAEVLRVAGGFLRRTGFFEQAVEVLERCVAVDPLKHGCTWQLKETYLWKGDLENARIVTDRLKAYWGRPPMTHDILLLLLNGKAEEARAQVSGWEQSTGAPMLLALAAHDLGDTAEYESRLSEIRAHPDEKSSPFWTSFLLAQAYAYAGNKDEAFQWLETASESDETESFRELFNPFLWNLHDDPRWADYRERLGMSEERLSAITFEVPEAWSSSNLGSE